MLFLFVFVLRVFCIALLNFFFLAEDCTVKLEGVKVIRVYFFPGCYTSFMQITGLMEYNLLFKIVVLFREDSCNQWDILNF